jgi:hypothetical protein
MESKGVRRRQLQMPRTRNLTFGKVDGGKVSLDISNAANHRG